MQFILFPEVSYRKFVHHKKVDLPDPDLVDRLGGVVFLAVGVVRQPRLVPVVDPDQGMKSFSINCFKEQVT